MSDHTSEAQAADVALLEEALLAAAEEVVSARATARIERDRLQRDLHALDVELERVEAEAVKKSEADAKLLHDLGERLDVAEAAGVKPWLTLIEQLKHESRALAAERTRADAALLRAAEHERALRDEGEARQALDQSKRELEQQLARNQAALATSVETQERTKAELDTTQGDLDAQRMRHSELERERDGLQATATSRLADLDTLRAEHAGVHSALEQARSRLSVLESAEQQRDAARGELDTLRAAMVQSVQREAELEQKITAAREQREHSDREILSAREVGARAERERDAARGEMEQLKVALTAEQARTDERQRELESAREQAHTTAQERDAARGETDALRLALQAEQQRSDERQREVATAHAEVHRLARELSESRLREPEVRTEAKTPGPQPKVATSARPTLTGTGAQPPPVPVPTRRRVGTAYTAKDLDEERVFTSVPPEATPARRGRE